MNMLTQDLVAAYRQAVPQATEYEPMARHTSFHIGGPARLYVVALSSDLLLHAIERAIDLNIPWYVFGGGTNILVADQGFDGVMVQAANRNIAITGDVMSAESGVLSVMAARQSVAADLTGFEWAVGLPGTVGGAVYGNAGCYGGEMKDAVVGVDAYRMKDGKRVRYTNEECHFDYRDSMFKWEPHIILGCEIRLRQAHDPAASRMRLAQILGNRKSEQPLGKLSAGCVFKNAEIDKAQRDALVQKGWQPMFGHDSERHIAAGWLVEAVGMKGMKIGDVEVSEKHGNFFLSTPGTRAEDILILISLIKQKVRDTFGIQLQEEVQLVGF